MLTFRVYAFSFCANNNNYNRVPKKASNRGNFLASICDSSTRSMRISVTCVTFINQVHVCRRPNHVSLRYFHFSFTQITLNQRMEPANAPRSRYTRLMHNIPDYVFIKTEPNIKKLHENLEAEFIRKLPGWCSSHS